MARSTRAQRTLKNGGGVQMGYLKICNAIHSDVAQEKFPEHRALSNCRAISIAATCTGCSALTAPHPKSAVSVQW
jgi:hypothetical protein